MAPRKTPQARNHTNTTTVQTSFDNNTEEDEIMDDNENHTNDGQHDTDSDGLISNNKNLKSNVWDYAKKISPDEASCLKCKGTIKTTNGSTSTLRKHLFMKHNLTGLAANSASKKKKTSLISRDRKIRLDHLANLAIFRDGRSFGDLRKSGIKQFLAEAIPGTSFSI